VGGGREPWPSNFVTPSLEGTWPIRSMPLLLITVQESIQTTLHRTYCMYLSILKLIDQKLGSS